jgi:hypothetical protein
MIGHLRAITLTKLRQLQKDPATFKAFLQGDKPFVSNETQATLNQVTRLAAQARAARKTMNARERKKIGNQIWKDIKSSGLYSPSAALSEAGLSLEKSWQILHYLLTGTAWDTDSILGKTILGGKEIGPDTGYGPARYLEPNEVKRVAKTLTNVSKNDLAGRFDLKAMVKAKVYSCDDDGELKVAQHYFAKVVSYYGKAAQRGDAMLLYLD